jgi:hypothetical protein
VAEREEALPEVCVVIVTAGDVEPITLVLWKVFDVSETPVTEIRLMLDGIKVEDRLGSPDTDDVAS